MSLPEFDRSLEQRLRELTVVNDLIKTLTSTLELPDVLQTVLDRIKILTQAEALSLLLYDREHEELVFAAAETLRENAVVGMRIPEGQGISSWVARTGQSALVNDVTRDPRFYGGIDRTSRFTTQSLLAVPLRREGRVLGVIEVANRYDGAAFSESDQRKLERIADMLSKTIDSDSLVQDAEAIRALLATVSATVPSEGASLLLCEAGGRELVFRGSRTLQPGVVDGMRIPSDKGIAGWVAQNRQSLRLDDVTQDPRYYPGVQAETNFVPRSMLCVPMLSKDAFLGVIEVINKIDGSTFTDEELRLTQLLADHAAIAIENASLYRQAHLASITDDLTGLGNTRLFNRMLPELLERGGPVSLLVLDLDSFKAVVDRHGHQAGSRTIGQIGRLIGRLVRPGDVAARFGGDEFVVILPGAEPAVARAVAEAIRAGIEALCTLEETDVDISSVTASVGVATFPDHAANAEELFHAADAAMYALKRQRKNAVAVAEARPAAREARSNKQASEVR